MIEASLRGELGDEEAEDLRLRLESDPDARAYLERVRAELDLLLGLERRELARVDWRRIRRKTLRLRLRRQVGFLINVALAALAAGAIFESEGLLRSLLCGLAAAVFLLRGLAIRREERAFVRRITWIEDPSGDYLERYRMTLRREWKRWKGESAGLWAGAVFLILLALIGRHPALCGVLAASFALSAIVHRTCIMRPLELEMREVEA